MASDEDSGFGPVMFNAQALSILQGVFTSTVEPTTEECPSKSASMKFMITHLDEENLRNLGYSQSQIDKLKPQEVEDILKAGTVR
ncbi:MAG: hypothetical protein PHP95_14225 [Desulfuromonadaceae bacterium]|nr:hypothetical protein [Desulfuromonadaceae bacterium]MDD2849605.1 hypothetical protein [Desulfuromonadaceae bacterium]MDD4130936.1 hypothetical protein [Desulfuromonadaceae bacterium]